MGKISYRPKRNHGTSPRNKKATDRGRDLSQEKEELLRYCEEEEATLNIEENELPDNSHKIISINSNKKQVGTLDNLKIVGDMDCEYHIFVEDYVYTYIYQLAANDLSKESSAILIGEIYGDSKEAVVRGIIPIKMDLLAEDNEWIDLNVLDDINEQKEQYFRDQDIIGWMHMQPGYGTMLTMKELREHRGVFEGTGSICMLVDAINKIETLFVYDGEELKEQSGYCMYYERNEQMQQYMLDHSFTHHAKEEIKDSVVSQFREIGKIRKAEYTQRKNLNFAVMAASIILIALTAVIVKMNDKDAFNQDAIMASASPQNTMPNELLDENMNLVVEPAEEIGLEAATLPEETAATAQIETELINPEEDSIQDVEDSVQAVAEGEEDKQVDEADYEIYVVQAGDTLADISYKIYGEAKRSVEIAKLNNIDNTDHIYVGQELKVPN